MTKRRVKVQFPVFREMSVEHFGEGDAYPDPDVRIETKEVEVDENGHWVDPTNGKTYRLDVQPEGIIPPGPLDDLPSAEEWMA